MGERRLSVARALLPKPGVTKSRRCTEDLPGEALNKIHGTSEQGCPSPVAHRRDIAKIAGAVFQAGVLLNNRSFLYVELQRTASNPVRRARSVLSGREPPRERGCNLGWPSGPKQVMVGLMSS